MSRTARASSRFAAFMLAWILAFCALPVSALATAKPTPTPAPEFNDLYDAETPQALRDRDLQGTACVLMDRASGRILYDKNAESKRYPASTTKVMTLLLALEYGHLNDKVIIPKEATDVPADSSRTPVKPGEEMPFVDLLYGMMIKSGNDAANAVAVIVSGSVPAFVQRMNERAKELGCTGTNFVNPHGYHDENHYSTAKDLALIAREGLRHNTFRAIVSAMEYTMSPTSQREKLRMATTNAMFVKSNKYYYEPMIGIKTGYHSKAGNCFVGAALKNGVYLISVTLHSTKTGCWMDTKRLMEYGFPQYKTYSFSELWGANPFYVSIENASQDDEGRGLLALDAVPGGSIQNYSLTRMPDEYEQTIEDYKKNMTLTYTSSLQAPIRKGDIIGKLTMPGPDGETLETTVVASRDVYEYQPLSPIEQLIPQLSVLGLTPVKLLLALTALIIVLLIVLRVYVGAKRSRRRKQLYKMRLEAYEKYKAMK